MLGAILVTGVIFRPFPITGFLRNKFWSVEIAEVIKIAEKFSLFFKNVNGA
jgi:hypothetical protein